MGISELDVLQDVSARLESAGLQYMVTGSIAMGFYAQPRMTRDIDLVVALTEADVTRVVDLFKADYYVSSEAVARAIRRQSMFNVIHNVGIIKVDCIVLKDKPYRREEFSRRRRVQVGEFSTWMVRIEDLILSKLVWALESKSAMQLDDVRNLLQATVDIQYVRDRSRDLDVLVLLEEALVEDE